MTELEKAIAELRGVGASRMSIGGTSTILNAVLSGAMIPATERDAAVAAAMKSLQQIVSHKPTEPPRDGKDANGHCAWRSYHEARAALDAITQPQADALARVRAEAVRVKPLVWEEPCKANNYTHIARSIFGDYYVHVDGGRHQAWLEAYVKPHENVIGPEAGHLWEAKAAAQADYEARERAAIGGVE